MNVEPVIDHQHRSAVDPGLVQLVEDVAPIELAEHQVEDGIGRLPEPLADVELPGIVPAGRPLQREGVAIGEARPGAIGHPDAVRRVDEQLADRARRVALEAGAIKAVHRSRRAGVTATSTTWSGPGSALPGWT